MINNFIYSFNEKRYHTFNYYLKTTYNEKVAKVIIDGHFSCPNRDGYKGIGGCKYCSNNGSGDSNTISEKDVLTQYENNKSLINKKWEVNKYIAYFQSYSNTYGPIEKIKNMLNPFLSIDEVAEISIATRCDCLNNEIINYLNSLTSIKPIWLEIGLQTSNKQTSKNMNLCYNIDDFKACLNKLEKTNIKVCIHIIDGLPYENEEIMLQTIKDINHLKFDAIKIHMLSIIDNSNLYLEYKQKPFPIISREEYIKIVVKQLELLRPEIIIERLTGDPIKDNLIEPKWILNKTTILNDIDKYMRKYDIYQGDKYE